MCIHNYSGLNCVGEFSSIIFSCVEWFAPTTWLWLCAYYLPFIRLIFPRSDVSFLYSFAILFRSMFYPKQQWSVC